MSKITSGIKRWPASTFGYVQSLLVAAVGVSSAFNVWTPTDAQVAALATLWTAATVLATIGVRRNVTANVTLPPH